MSTGAGIAVAGMWVAVAISAAFIGEAVIGVAVFAMFATIAIAAVSH